MRGLAANFTKWTLVASRRRFQNFNACSQMMVRAQDTLSICGGHTGLPASGAGLSVNHIVLPSAGQLFCDAAPVNPIFH